MKVATLNHPARYGRPRLNNLAVDVVAMQEQPDRPRLPRGWRKHRPRRGRSTLVAWRHQRIPRRDRGHVHLGDTPNQRYLTWVRYRWLIVASVHLPAFKDKNGPQHTAQMERIAAWLAAHPSAVVLGDFNADPDTPWCDPLREVGAHYATAPTHGRKRLDHAWSISRRVELVGTVDTGSDHRALIVNVD